MLIGSIEFINGILWRHSKVINLNLNMTKIVSVKPTKKYSAEPANLFQIE